MSNTIFASAGLGLDFGEYTPLLVVCAALAAIFVLFKLLGVTGKILWKLLINAIIGAAMLCLFDIVFVKYLHMDFFHIPLNWPNVLIVGVLGIPGILLLLIIRAII